MGYSNINFPQFIQNGLNPVIFDIGSYNGADAQAFKNRYPSGKVYAFEASSKNMPYFEHLTTIEVRNMALGDINGTIKFFPSIGAGLDGSGSILQPSANMATVHPSLKFEEEEVECMTISKFCEIEGINKIDCIHIDAQGAEYKILSNMGDLRPDCIFAETCEYSIYDGAGSLDLLDNLMFSMGYKIEQRLPYDTFYVLKNNLK